MKTNSARFIFFSSSCSSPSPSGSNNDLKAKRDGQAIGICKRDKAKKSKWGFSDKLQECRMDDDCNGGGGGCEGEGGYNSQSPLSPSGGTSRKRIKLQGKVLEVCGPVDPALVPRKQRSAMSKRISQSASPPLSDSKRKLHQAAASGALLFNGSSTPNKVTKDEEEVAEALTAMASLITVCKPLDTKESSRLVEDNSVPTAPSTSALEGKQEEGSKFLVPYYGTTGSNPLLRVKDSSEAIMVDPPAVEQPTAASVDRRSDEKVIGSSPPDSPKKLSSTTVPMDSSIPLRDATNLFNPLEASLKNFLGMPQPTQFDSLLLRNQEMRLWPVGSSSVEHDMQSLKRDHQGPTLNVNPKDPHVQTGPGSRNHELLATPSLSKSTPSLSKAASCSNSNMVSGRHGIVNGVLAEKLSSTCNKQQLGRCATHVNISRLIKNYQKAEKDQQSLRQNSSQSMAKESTDHSRPASSVIGGSRNGMFSSMSSVSQVERNILESRNRMLQDGRLLQAQQAAVLSGACAAQKQDSNLLSLSSVGDTKSFHNGKPQGQLQVPYHPNQHVMAYAFPRGSYTSQNQEHLAAGTAQQVQLQLPSYLASSQLYGPNMGQAAGGAATKQQQQLMWQAHLAHYRPPFTFPPKWQQNGRLHESSSSSSPPIISQPPPSIFPLTADFNPHNLHQPFFLPMPQSSSSLSSRSKQGPSQLQMVCNADGFR